MELKFTVITVVFNAEQHIRKTVESVLNQVYSPYEYLVIECINSDNSGATKSNNVFLTKMSYANPVPGATSCPDLSLF